MEDSRAEHEQQQQTTHGFQTALSGPTGEGEACPMSVLYQVNPVADVPEYRRAYTVAVAKKIAALNISMASDLQCCTCATVSCGSLES